MRIGITERGDAGIDLGWVDKIRSGNYDGAILITKKITPLFIQHVTECYNLGIKLIVHATCTGWGGTQMEPNVPSYKEQIDNLMRLHEKGFPLKNCVLRIDPIIPSEPGIKYARDVIEYAKEKGIIPTARIRISVYDEYMHVKERLNKAGYNTFYPYRKQIYASIGQFDLVADMLSEYDYTFYTCAEPTLKQREKKYNQIIESGCISEQDLQIMGLKIPADMSINKQNRKGCLCLSCKTELLTEKKQCPNKCMYCYWKDA